MFTDIWTVCLKEWHEHLYQRNKIWKTLANELLALAIFGVFFPSPFENNGGDTEASFLLWYLVPIVLLITKVPDSFAGERERHTLPTLLASRLSNRAIVLGKIGAIVSYGWIAALIVNLFSLIKVNIINWENAPVFYSWDFWLFGLGLSLLTATLVVTVGVLISFDAKTVKQAQQSLVFYLLAASFIPAILLIALSIFLPEATNKSLVSVLEVTSSTIFALIFGLSFAAFDLLLIVITLKRFQRNQLIWD